MSEHILKTEELRKRNDEELGKQLQELTEELFNLRFQHHATAQLSNIRRIGHVKRNIARVKTILRERQVR